VLFSLEIVLLTEMYPFLLKGGHIIPSYPTEIISSGLHYSSRKVQNKHNACSFGSHFDSSRCSIGSHFDRNVSFREFLL